MVDEDTEQVQLVDKGGKTVGAAGKLEAHQNGGKLHRAISLVIFNSKGEMMLQQRSDTKYHSAGLWTNTCCSHPMEHEQVIDAAHRRLQQEMGFDCKMKEEFTFTYKKDVGNDLTEWEFDHVLFGLYDGEPVLNEKEAKDWRRASLKWLKDDVKNNRSSYTEWFNLLITDEKLSEKFMDSVGRFFKDNNIRTNHGPSSR